MVNHKLVLIAASSFFFVTLPGASLHISQRAITRGVTFLPLRTERRKRSSRFWRYLSTQNEHTVLAKSDDYTFPSVMLNMLPWKDDGLSHFARSLEETRKRMGLPDDLLSRNSTVVYANSTTTTTSFEVRVREAAAAAEEESLQVFKRHIVQQKYEGSSSSSRYQRIEEWDEVQRAKAKNGTWEERVQFDGLRHGNQYNQNEILRRHLKF